MKNAPQNPYMNDFKFRAECPADIRQLSARIPLSAGVILSIDTDQFGCEAIMRVKKTVTVEQVRAYMREVEDGHVMIQTVAKTEEYTGDRDWSIPT